MNKTGFGFLRLPMREAPDGKAVDLELTEKLVDRFLALGGRYFDTAYTYLEGESERAFGRAVAQRYPRDSYQVADKLPGWKVQKPGDCPRYFEEQLARCGVDYFDVYLIHWLNAANYAVCQRFDEFAFLARLKSQGLARATGFSYHDGPGLLDRILTEHPEVDFVQLQINYLDWESPSIQARACYETAVRHGKRVLVMEPVKGGSLASPPPQARQLLQQAGPGSMADWAIRFAASLPQVQTVLSGMNSLEQVEENMRDRPALGREEYSLLQQAAKIIRAATAIPCTGCGYCQAGCPEKIAIPQLFALYNDYARSPAEKWKMQHSYEEAAAAGGRASACIRCGQCARNCPQQLEIPALLAQVAGAFEG